MPDNFTGLQNSMMGISINPDGSLNYNNTQPQNLGFRSMVDMNNDVQNFDNQFVFPDRFSGMGQTGPVKSNMNAPQIASPRTVIDQNRIPGRIQEAVEPSTRFRDASNIAEYLQGNPQIMDNIQNTIGSGIDKFKSGLGSIKDFAIDKGTMGRNLLGSAGAMALGLPGIVGSGAMALMGGLGNAFEDRQLSGDGTTVDEYGRSYNASDLNKMNARGGYYTEAARSSRRRTNRINDMLSRKAKGKRISAANLARLQAQEAAQEQARLAATRQMAEQNRQSGSGGYQAGYGGGFMGGSGTAADMGSFRDGGLASMFTRRR